MPCSLHYAQTLTSKENVMALMSAGEFVKKLEKIPPVFENVEGGFEQLAEQALSRALKNGSKLLEASLTFHVHAGYLDYVDAAVGYGGFHDVNYQARIDALRERLRDPQELLQSGIKFLDDAGFTVLSVDGEIADKTLNNGEFIHYEDYQVLVKVRFAPKPVKAAAPLPLRTW